MNPDPHADAGPDTDADAARELLSALADGETSARESARACAAWANAAPEARSRWHAYQLIGDVLRSEDLASPPARDQAFLERLRLRLAGEPAIMDLEAAQSMAPVVGIGAKRPRRAPRWVWPAALAAGVMALATVMVVALGPAGGSGASAPLAAAPAGATVVAARADVQATVLEASGLGSRIVRDAQLDRYLRAHRDYGTALPGSLPGGPGRSITTVSLDR